MGKQPSLFKRRYTWLLVFALLAGCSSASRHAEVAGPGAPVQSALRSEDSASRLNELNADATQPRRRTCWKALCDAFTKPWYGNYLGPDNFGYDKKPIDDLDAAAREHDLAYDRCKCAGFAGAFWNLDAGRADLELARRAFLALPSLDFGGRLMGVATGVTMGFIGAIKTPLAELRHAVHPKSEPPVPSPSS